MAPPKAPLTRRMAIIWLVRMAMMVTVMAGPPQRTTLRRTAGQPRTTKGPSEEPKCPVAKQPVMKELDGKHPQHEQPTHNR